MKQFTYVVTDDLGLHVRPAGILAKLVKDLDCTVTVALGDKSAEAKRLVALMGLGVKKGDTITITCEGNDEEAAFVAVQKFMNENL